MRNFKVYRAFNEFLKDPNISLRAKGFLTMVLIIILLLDLN